MCITKSLCGPIESSTTLETNYTSINTLKNNKKKHCYHFNIPWRKT